MQWSFICFSISELAFEGVYCPGFISLNIEQDMNFLLHLSFLIIQLFSNRSKLLFTELLFAQMIRYHTISLIKLEMLTLKDLYSFVKLVNFQLNIWILLTVLSVMVIFITECSLQIVQFVLILSFQLVCVFIIFYFDQFHLIILLFLELGYSFLLVTHFLHVFVLVDIFLVSQLLHFIRKLPILGLHLSHLHLQGLVIFNYVHLLRTDWFWCIICWESI